MSRPGPAGSVLVLPISELVRFGAGLDDDWHHQVADAAASRWGLDRPVFLRSSASHVLVGRPLDGSPRLVLRLRPDTASAAAVLERSAAAAGELWRAGAPVAPAVTSRAGRLVEHVDGLVATAVVAVEGDPLDDDDLAEAAAEQWGATLARVHAAGGRVSGDGELPHATDFLDGSDVARALRAALGRLPRDPQVHGLLHGDAEPDNVVLGPDGPVLVDTDDVRTGWFVADVGFALRAWAAHGDPAAAPDLSHDVPAAFVRGYRSERPLSDEELGWLPLMARVAAYEDWCDLQQHLAAPVDPAWPDWALALDAKVRARATRLEAALLAD